MREFCIIYCLLYKKRGKICRFLDVQIEVFLRMDSLICAMIVLFNDW